MNQKQVWNKIASEWFEFKTKPALHVQEFLKNKTGKILDLGSGAGRHLQQIGFGNNSLKISPNNNKLQLGGRTISRGQIIKPHQRGGGRESSSEVASRVGTTKIPIGKMYLVDFSEKMIKLAKKRAKQKNIDAEFVVSDLTKLSFENNFFDSAIAIASLHCLKPTNQKKAIQELFRVLKPNAQAEIAVWNKNSKPFKNAGKEKYISWRDKGKRYYYLFEEKEIHKLFKDAGFKIISKEKPRRNIIFIVQK